MQLIGSFNSRQEAEMVAAMLEGHGVTAKVVGDDAGGAAGLNLGATGYRLAVPDDLRAEAEALLAPSVEGRQMGRAVHRRRRPLALQIAVALVLVSFVVAVLASLLH